MRAPARDEKTDVGEASHLTLHASAVAFGDRAVMAVGQSGSGKSALALQLMALGAMLVSDDQVILSRHGGRILVSAPPEAPGLMEARGVGLLTAPLAGETHLVLIVDLDDREQERLPPQRKRNVLGIELDLVFGGGAANLPAAICQYVKHGRGA